MEFSTDLIDSRQKLIVLEKLYKNDQSLFHEVVDTFSLPMMINNSTHLDYVLCTEDCDYLMGLEPGALLENGIGNQKKKIHPGNLNLQMKLLEDFGKQFDPHKSIQYYQYIKTGNDLESDYSWIFTMKKFISENEFLSMYLKIDQIGPIGKLVKKSLNDLFLSTDSFFRFESLTIKEREVLKLIIDGKTNIQVSDELFISKHTVRTHRNRIWKKLNIGHFRDVLKYEIMYD